MTYTSSKFVLLKGNCQICLGEHKSCKQNGEVIHCRSLLNAPQGYVFVGEDGINFGMYAPARDNSQSHDSEASRAKREARLAKQAKEKEEALKVSPSLEERDRKIKSYSPKLTRPQNADLIRRGLTQDEIDIATSNRWLFGGLHSGYGVAAVDPFTGLLCGAQIAKDNRSTAKYTWGVFTDQNPLKETGENPLFVWVSRKFDKAKPYENKYSEGSLKSLIRAFFEWRTNPQIIVIGGAGGIIRGKALDRVLGVYPDAKSHTFLPDHDSQNLTKNNLPNAYGGLAEALPQVKFADWGHWQQTKEQGGKDCDETYGTNAFNGYALRSPSDWLDFFGWEGTKKLTNHSRWIKAKSFTPDIKFHAEYLTSEHVPIAEINSIITVKSDFATGKTEGLIKSFVADAHSNGQGQWLLGHRNILLRQTVSRLQDVTNIGMVKEKPALLSSVDSGKAGCLEQLANNRIGDHHFKNQIVILDEADQDELHLLMSSTLKDRRDIVLSRLTSLIQQADVILLTSATINDQVVDFVAKLRGNPTTKIIKYENTFKHKQRFMVYQNGDKGTESLLAVKSRAMAHIERLKLLKDGNIDEVTRLQSRGLSFKPFAIACDSQRELEAFDDICKQAGLRTKRIDGKNENEDNADWIKNLDDRIIENEIDVLLFSPTANSGVSCKLKGYFSDIYCLYFGVIDIDSFLQMPLRIRDSEVNRHIGCPKFTAIGTEDINSAMPQTLIKFTSDYVTELGNLALDGDEDESRLKELMEDLLKESRTSAEFRRFAQLRALINHEKQNLWQCVSERLTMLGHEFELSEGDGLSEDQSGLIKETKEAIKRTEAIRIANSETIPIAMAQKIAVDGDAKYVDRLKAQKAFLVDRVGAEFAESNRFDSNFIHFTKNTKPDYLKSLEMRFLAQNLDIAQDKANKKIKWILENRRKTSLQDLLKSDLVRLQGLIDIGIPDLINGGATDLHGDHESITAICRRAAERKQKTRLALSQGAKEENMQFVGRLIALLGYGFKVAKKEKTEDDKTRNLNKIHDEARESALIKLVCDRIGVADDLPLSIEGKANQFGKAYAGITALLGNEIKEATPTNQNYKKLLSMAAIAIFDKLYSSVGFRLKNNMIEKCMISDKNDAQIRMVEGIQNTTLPPISIKEKEGEGGIKSEPISPNWEYANDEWIDIKSEPIAAIPVMAIAPSTPLSHGVVSPQPPKNESLYDRIKRLNAPLTDFCQSQYTAAQYA